MVVMMMTASLATPDRLREILQIGKLAALGGVGEIGRELTELARRAGIPLRLRGLSGGLQIRRNLLGHLCVLSRVRLLNLLQRTHQLRKR